jgi:hypothetical protein
MLVEPRLELFLIASLTRSSEQLEMSPTDKLLEETFEVWARQLCHDGNVEGAVKR